AEELDALRRDASPIRRLDCGRRVHIRKVHDAQDARFTCGKRLETNRVDRGDTHPRRSAVKPVPSWGQTQSRHQRALVKLARKLGHPVLTHYIRLGHGEHGRKAPAELRGVDLPGATFEASRLHHAAAWWECEIKGACAIKQVDKRKRCPEHE